MSGRTPETLAHLLATGEGSDLTVICGGCEFRLHKSVVCSQSRVIDTALHGGYKEARTSVIRTEEFQPEVIKYMVDFLYLGDYSVIAFNVALYENEMAANNMSDANEQAIASEGGGDISDSHHTVSVDEDIPVDEAALPNKSEKGHEDTAATNLSDDEAMLRTALVHIHVNIAGDYYDIPSLRRLAIIKLYWLLREHWRPNLFPALVEISTAEAGDADLHDLLAETAVHHLTSLVDDPAFEALYRREDFARRILDHVSRRLDGLREQPAPGEFWQPLRCRRCRTSVWAVQGCPGRVAEFVCGLCRSLTGGSSYL